MEVVLRQGFEDFYNINEELKCDHKHELHQFRSCDKLIEFVKSNKNKDKNFIVYKV
jgi:hypothetical protein